MEINRVTSRTTNPRHAPGDSIESLLVNWLQEHRALIECFILDCPKDDNGHELMPLPILLPRTNQHLTLCGCLLVGCAFSAHGQNHRAWRDYGGAADSAQYSALQ